LEIKVLTPAILKRGLLIRHRNKISFELAAGYPEYHQYSFFGVYREYMLGLNTI
jgi:hypothetical protein